jgi:hypothetical protein
VVDDKGTKTACVWLDKDHSDGIKWGGLHIWMTAFSSDYTNKGTKWSADWYCKHPATMQFYNKGDKHSYWPPATAKSRVVRDSITASEVEVLESESYNITETIPQQRRKRSPAMASELVVSDDHRHSAVDLCSSDTSFGPDFVSLFEEVYCDMETHTLWPLCAATIADKCFDRDLLELRNGPAALRKRASYKNVSRWT